MYAVHSVLLQDFHSCAIAFRLDALRPKEGVSNAVDWLSCDLRTIHWCDRSPLPNPLLEPMFAHNRVFESLATL